MKKDRLVTLIGVFILIAPLLLYLPNFHPAPNRVQTVPPRRIMFTDLQGRVRDVYEFRGKMVIIEFMVTNSTQCFHQLKNILEAVKGLEDKVVVIQLSVQNERPSELYRYMALNHVQSKKNWIVGRDSYGVAASYHLRGTPSLLIIDPEGKIVLSASGIIASSTIQSILKMYFKGSRT